AHFADGLLLVPGVLQARLEPIKPRTIHLRWLLEPGAEPRQPKEKVFHGLLQDPRDDHRSAASTPSATASPNINDSTSTIAQTRTEKSSEYIGAIREARTSRTREQSCHRRQPHHRCTDRSPRGTRGATRSTPHSPTVRRAARTPPEIGNQRPAGARDT